MYGSLLGACVGAALATGTVGLARADAPTPSGALDPATCAQVGNYRGLFGTGGAPSGDLPWPGVAVRAGWANRCDPMETFVEGLGPQGRPRLRVAAEACVAAGVSAAIDGCDAATVRALAIMAGDLAARVADDMPGPDVGVRLQWACAVVTRTEDDPAEVLDVLVGTSAAEQECVPAAFALLALNADGAPGSSSRAPDVVDACARAAALGGASDAMAVIVGAVLGAAHGPQAFPEDVIAAVETAWPSLRSSAADLARGR